MSNLTLYDIEDGLRALLDTEEMTEGEDRLAILQEIADATDLAQDKRDNVVRFIRAAEAMARAKEDEATKLHQEASTLRRKVEQVEERCARLVAEYGTKPKDPKKHPYLTGRVFEMTLKRNPEHVEVRDEAVVPAEYKAIAIKMPLGVWQALVDYAGDDAGFAAITQSATDRAIVSISKSAIKKAIKEDGMDVPGATIVDGGLVLKIK